jgi:hypothetical protein
MTANVLLLLVGDFARLYWTYGATTNWNLRLSRWDALYVAMGTLTTAGTGGIQPHSEFARRLLTAQMGVDLVVFTLLAGVVVWKLTEGRPPGPPPSTSKPDGG